MLLNRIDDPRSNLDKAKRRELVDFAKSQGITEFTFNGMLFKVDDWPPALIMREFLRSRGLTRINPTAPPLGSQVRRRTGYQDRMQAPQVQASGIAADAVSDLARQLAQQPKPERKVSKEMTINELRAECKKRGIHLGRRDNMKSMREKIEAHG